MTDDERLHRKQCGKEHNDGPESSGPDLLRHAHWGQERPRSLRTRPQIRQ